MAEKVWSRRWEWALTGLNLVDGLLTYLSVSVLGIATELNTFLAYWLTVDPVLFFLIKFCLVEASLKILRDARSPSSLFWLRIMVMIYVVVVLHHFVGLGHWIRYI